ncbi:MAG: hypothetical protein ACREER_06795 [Alphaproteobacteria bacterium]
MAKPLNFRSKIKTEVEIVFLDGSSVSGMTFLTLDQRIVDAFNDERSFLPFEASDGSLMVIRKDAVRYLKPKARHPRRGDDAHSNIATM